MTLTTAPDTRDDVVRRATEVAPLLRASARAAEQNRRLDDEVIEALGAAGIFRMRVARQHGGQEADAVTMFRTISELARGDGSAAWVSSVWSMCAWLTGLYPDHVQEEVFASPDSRVCGVLSPTAVAVPVEGGLVVNGSWHFVSGALHSQWQLVLAMAPTPDGASQWPVMALVPMTDLQIVDDWDTAGLRGTGSVTTVATDVFVSGDRVLPMVAILQGSYASVRNGDSPMFRAPMMATGCASFTGTAVGLAQAALHGFVEQLPGRKITYTDYAEQGQAPLTHRQVAEATMKIDEAEFHALRLAGFIDERGTGEQPWTLIDRIRARAALGRVFQLSKEAVDILANAAGGSSIYLSQPIQRIARDLQALNLHALMHPDTNLELYGRVLCGVEPNTMYI
jgi:alkylation response protein AidB-like acyl-CoA dehydrogenase